MFSKKKQNAEGESSLPIEPTYAKSEFASERDNYGDSDRGGEQMTLAGKVGKAQHGFFRESERAQESGELRSISAAELAQHKSVESAWLSLEGTVYDVTSYLRYHPGGRLILQGCGAECAPLFNKYHAWVNADFLLRKYKLGFLIRE